MIAAFAHAGYGRRIAIADTLGAAWALARSSAVRSSPERTAPYPVPRNVLFLSPLPRNARYLAPIENSALVSECRGEDQGEGGFAPPRTSPTDQPPYRIILAGQHLAALELLPVERLRLNERAVDLLHQLGIFSIRSLLALPRAGLSCRSG